MKKILLSVSAGLIVLSVISFMFLNGSKPKVVCAAPGASYSGFVDEEKDCPITDESYEAIRDYNSKPKVGRIVGAVLALSGVTVGIVGLVKKSE